MKRSPLYLELIFVFLIVVIAFFFRYGHLTSTAWITENDTSYLGMIQENHSVFHFSDTDYYLKIANDWLNGKGFNLPFPPPGTIFFLIFLSVITGGNIFLMKVGYALISSMALLPIYVIARELFGKAVACTTIVLCSVSFTLIFLSGALNIETVYLFFVSSSLGLYTILYFEKGIVYKCRLPFSFVVGISAGLAALTRSEFLLVLGLMLMFIFLKKKWHWSLKTKVSFLICLGFFSAISPWTYRNYTYLHEFNQRKPEMGLPVFVPISMNGPFNFLEGHFEGATGTYSPGISMEIKGAAGVELNPGNKRHLDYVLNGYKLGWKFLIENPDKELKMIHVKIKTFLNGFSNGFFLTNFPMGLSGTVENKADSFVSGSKAILFLGIGLFIFGSFSIFHKKESDLIRFLPIMMMAIVLFVTFVFYGLSRLVYPLLPFYYMVISVSLVSIAMRLSIMNFFYRKEVKVTLLLLLFSVAFYQSREMYVVKKMEQGKLKGYTVTYSGKVGKPR